MSASISPAHRSRSTSALKNAQTVVDGAAAAAPTAGQVLKAVDAEHFEWGTDSSYTDAAARAAVAAAAADGQLVRRAGAGLAGVTYGDVISHAAADFDASGQAASAQAAAIAAAAADATTKANNAQSAAALDATAKADAAQAASAPSSQGVRRTFAAGAPGINDDTQSGQVLHAEWFDSLTTPGQYTVWVCDDPTNGAAVWTKAGSSSGGSTMEIGHSYDRPDPVTAGSGARFFDEDSLVAYTSTGVATPGWVVEFGAAFGPDKAGLLCTSVGAYLSGINGAAYTLGNITVAILFYLDSTIASDKAIGAFGARSAAHGMEILLGTSAGNTILQSYQNGTFTTIKTFSGALATGWHAVCIAPITGSKWRYSFDGSVIAETSLGAAYAAPTSATIGFGVSASPDVPLPGKVAAMGVWNSQLSDADIVALATLPGTPTCRLPITASTGVPTIWVEAARYDETLPAQLRARGTTPLIVQNGVRKWTP